MYAPCCSSNELIAATCPRALFAARFKTYLPDAALPISARCIQFSFSSRTSGHLNSTVGYVNTALCLKFASSYLALYTHSYSMTAHSLLIQSNPDNVQAFI